MKRTVLVLLLLAALASVDAASLRGEIRGWASDGAVAALDGGREMPSGEVDKLWVVGFARAAASFGCDLRARTDPFVLRPAGGQATIDGSMS